MLGKRAAERKAVVDWNRAHHPGDCVRFYPELGKPEFRETRTRTVAMLTCSGMGVLFIQDAPGFVLLEQVEGISEEQGGQLPAGAPEPSRCARSGAEVA